MKTNRLSTIVISAVTASVLVSSCALAAMDDVIVWNSARTQAQIENTLVNGYTSTTGMTMWWQFNNADNLVYDAVSAGTKGVIKGSPTSIETETSFDSTGRAASGFTSKDNWLVADIPQSCFEAQTYEMWVRNPQLNGLAVFWSITGNEAGGDSGDSKRLAINADGSLTMMDRGYYTGWPWYTSSALTWDPDKWYQITVAMEFKGVEKWLIGVKVYRGAEGDTSVTKLLDYDSSVSVGQDYWMSVGAHPDGIPGVFDGGFLGADPASVPEPGSMLVLMGGLTGLGGFAIRRRRS